MITNWKRLSLVPLMAAALWIGGCTDQTAPADRLLGPDAAAFAKGGKSAEKKSDKATKIKGKKKDGTAAIWKAVVGKMPEPKIVKSEATVDASQSAMIENNGHYLYVPKGTVSEPTTFRIRAYKKVVDAELGLTEVAVELRAFTIDPVTGEDVDAGADGFDGNKVYLGLTYSWATNFDSAGATVLWLKPSGTSNGTVEGIEVERTTVDPAGRFVIAELDHFSDYVLAVP